MKRTWATLICLALAASAPAQEVGRTDVKGTSVIEYQVPQSDAPDVDYFISQTSAPAPLVLFIQGSGCGPVFTPHAAHVFGYLDTAWSGKYAAMVVNKPYAAKEPRQDGTATTCPAQFNQYFTLENWARDLATALAHARRLPWVAPGPVLVIGVSEGATAAAALAARDPQVSHVALISGSGPTQFYDFVIDAYRAGASDSETRQKLEELEATRQRILAAPDSASEFAWGHPYKRWASFFRNSSTLSLLRSQSKVYIAGGMQDSSVPMLASEALAAELSGAGRDVTVRRLADAGHGLLPAGGSYATLWPEYQRIMAWFASSRQP